MTVAPLRDNPLADEAAEAEAEAIVAFLAADPRTAARMQDGLLTPVEIARAAVISRKGEATPGTYTFQPVMSVRVAEDGNRTVTWDWQDSLTDYPIACKEEVVSNWIDGFVFDGTLTPDPTAPSGPPTGTQVADHIDAGMQVEKWDMNRWKPSAILSSMFRTPQVAALPQPGWRLADEPGPYLPVGDGVEPGTTARMHREQ